MNERSDHLNWGRRTARCAVILLAVLPALLFAQGTRIEMPKNKYNVQDDVKLGREAAAQAEREFPLLRDAEIESYVNDVGQRIVSAIPAEFRQPQSTTPSKSSTQERSMPLPFRVARCL